MIPLAKFRELEEYRRFVLGLAYRITGSFSTAEDLAQEVLVRWSSADTGQIGNPKAWISKTATRLALDYLKSARVQRESYVGPWLPEPFIEDGADPEAAAELDQSLSMALLVVLEQLSPAERVVYILHEIFDYRHAEISDFLGISDANSRQLKSRAMTRISRGEPRSRPELTEHARLTSAFMEATRNGNLDALKAWFADGIKFHSDGGGNAPAALLVLSGPEVIASFLIENVTAAFHAEGTTVQWVWFNGAPGLLMKNNDLPVTAFNFEIRNGEILAIHALRNPDKLKFFQPNPRHLVNRKPG